MRLVVAAIVALAALGGCATRQPVWDDRQRVINIPGKDTASLDRNAALQRMLTKSARVTVDHGYRYFTATRPIPASNGALNLLPGSDLTIRLYRENETRFPAPGVWDAYTILGAARAANASPRD